MGGKGRGIRGRDGALRDGHSACPSASKGNERLDEGQRSGRQGPSGGLQLAKHHPHSLFAGRSHSGYEQRAGCVEEQLPHLLRRGKSRSVQTFSHS